MLSSKSTPLRLCPTAPRRAQCAITVTCSHRHQLDTSRADTDPNSARFAAIALAALVSIATPAFAADSVPDAPTSTSSDSSVLRSVLRAPFRASADFLRSRQQNNGGAFFLGPIQVSRQRLEAALTAINAADGSEGYEKALKSLRAASLDCYGGELQPEQQDYKMGDSCKLRLIVKNATSLTKDADLVADAEAQVRDIVRNFQLADDFIDRAKDGDVDAAQAAPSMIQTVLDANIKLETTVKQCLGLGEGSPAPA